MNLGVSARFTRRLAGVLTLAGAALVGSGPAVAAPGAVPDPASLAPTRVVTVAEGKCGPKILSTAGVECQGWDATQIRGDNTVFVVGFANNAEQDEKAVLQTVATFDLAPVKAQLADAQVAHAFLNYSEASTMRRSPAGDSEYGVLPTCNTALGVPSTPWNGDVNKIVKTNPAATDGHTGAETGGAGSWDVTPQIVKWLESGATQGAFVMRADDESLTPQGQRQCLSYVIDITVNIEFAPLP
jgi:hypothetical protein